MNMLHRLPCMRKRQRKNKVQEEIVRSFSVRLKRERARNSYGLIPPPPHLRHLAIVSKVARQFCRPRLKRYTRNPKILQIRRLNWFPIRHLYRFANAVAMTPFFRLFTPDYLSAFFQVFFIQLNIFRFTVAGP